MGRPTQKTYLQNFEKLLYDYDYLTIFPVADTLTFRPPRLGSYLMRATASYSNVHGFLNSVYISGTTSVDSSMLDRNPLNSATFNQIILPTFAQRPWTNWAPLDRYRGPILWNLTNVKRLTNLVSHMSPVSPIFHIVSTVKMITWVFNLKFLFL